MWQEKKKIEKKKESKVINHNTLGVKSGIARECEETDKKLKSEYSLAAEMKRMGWFDRAPAKMEKSSSISEFI